MYTSYPESRYHAASSYQHVRSTLSRTVLPRIPRAYSMPGTQEVANKYLSVKTTYPEFRGAEGKPRARPSQPAPAPGAQEHPSSAAPKLSPPWSNLRRFSSHGLSGRAGAIAHGSVGGAEWRPSGRPAEPATEGGGGMGLVKSQVSDSGPERQCDPRNLGIFTRNGEG